MHQPDAELPTVPALGRDVRGENGTAQDEQRRMALREGHELGDTAGRVLSVGVHHQRVGESATQRDAAAGEHGCSGAAVVDDQHGLPVLQRLGHDGAQAQAGVVGRQQEQMRG